MACPADQIAKQDHRFLGTSTQAFAGHPLRRAETREMPPSAMRHAGFSASVSEERHPALPDRLLRLRAAMPANPGARVTIDPANNHVAAVKEIRKLVKRQDELLVA
jgi:hypothetical protein